MPPWLLRKSHFCFLRTALHSSCEVIDLFESEHGPDTRSTFMFVPQSRTITRKMSTFVTVESLESYLIDETVLAANSANYFMVSCSYFEKTEDGINRLTAAPVFTMTGRTVGIVLQDCRHRRSDPGAEMKVALKATHLRALMMLLGH
ncbi:hypothetical protein BS78_10G033600 [Paspalum vaginatum]|nr:hypothetical protein BS78_10G033600 [Paspalum vaginatum]